MSTFRHNGCGGRQSTPNICQRDAPPAMKPDPTELLKWRVELLHRNPASWVNRRKVLEGLQRNSSRSHRQDLFELIAVAICAWVILG
jgi:hypothetical protein